MTDVTPSEVKVQQESIQFNQPVSESSTTSIASLANFLRETILPVGSVVYSMLTEVQFQAQNDASPARWIISDGRSVVGSKYATVTGNSNVPDLRGVYMRGKNGARSTGTGNPDGDLALGTYQADQFGSHNHNYSDPGHTHGHNARALGSGEQVGGGDTSFPFAAINNAFTGINFEAQGGNETRPRSVTLNPFIRIN